jgi:nuclear pore complex protein Nup188
LDEIKQDTLWLGKQAQIDEVSALRIVVLEWQNRPNSQLLGRFSEEEITSLQEVSGIDSLSLSVGDVQAIELPQYSGVQRADASTDSSQGSRRFRLFHLCLTEKLHILKVSQRLFSAALRRRMPSNHELSGREEIMNQVPRSTNLEGLGKSIFGLQEEGTRKHDDLTSPEKCIKAIRLRIDNLENGRVWFTSDGLEVEIAFTWYANNLEELVQIIQILFLQLQLSKVIPSSELLLSWLRLMVEYEFLGPIVPVRYCSVSSSI